MSLLKTYLYKFSEGKFNLSFLLFLIIPICILTVASTQAFSPKIVYLLSGFVFTILLSFDFFLIFFVLILIVFTPYFFEIHTSVIFSLFLIFSVLWNFRFKRNSYHNPVIGSLLIFIFLASLSIYNAPKTIHTVMDYSNLVSFSLLIFIIPLVFDNRKRIDQIFYIYVVAILIHSLLIIIESLSMGKRTFGLLDVFYVDLAGLGVLYSIIYFLYNIGLKRYIFGFCATVILIGLILSQTRNAWLSTVVALFSLFIFLFIKGKKYRINRKFILMIMTVFFIISGSIFLIAPKDFNIDVGRKLEAKTQKIRVTDNPESVGANSFFSRLLIWNTAINAFVKKPVLGIGLYSFKYTSREYNTIPKPFFKQYVEYRTPHVAYLEVLVESGIVGFIGFIIFLLSIYKLLIKSARLVIKKESIPQLLLILVSIVYISFSMIMTEAWLYGQYIVWFGVIVGLLVLNNKMLNSEALS